MVTCRIHNRPTTIQDALLRAKPLAEERANPVRNFNNYNNYRGRNRGNFHQGGQNRGVTAVALEQNYPHIRCHGCNQMGHYQSHCPDRQNPNNNTRTNPPPRDQQNQRGRGNGGQTRGRGRAARTYATNGETNPRGRGRGKGNNARAYAAIGDPTFMDEEDERATLFAAIDNPRARQQYSVIQTTADHQGAKFDLLIDCGSTDSFLSPKCLRKLGLNQRPVKKMIVELANGKEVISCQSVGTVEFELGGHSTSANFRTLPLGIYDGILGMDWLSRNQAHIHCAQGNFSFKNLLGEEVLIQGTNGKPKAHLVKASRLLKGLRKGQQIFVVKLNKIEDSLEGSQPEWLKEFSYIFPEELTNLPPPRDIDHEIEVTPGSEPVSKRP